MNDQKGYIVFFDLDRTILGTNSGYALGMAAYRKGLMGKHDLLRAVFQMVLYKLGLKAPEKIIADTGKWLGGLSQETVRILAIDAVDNYLMNSVYSGFYDELILHKSQGAQTAILSSAISDICSRMASNLNIDSVISTVMQCSNGILTGLPVGDYCYGDEKRIRLSEFCRENGFDPRRSWYYADSISDLPALELTGNPVCINPDTKLRKAAIRKGWRIISWKNRSRKK